MLKTPVTFTTKVYEFVAHNVPKMTYGKAPLGTEFFIKSHELLFEQGINDIEITVMDWDGVPGFFATGENSSIPFDIFAAGFYLITRYEEYLPHVQDEHERFPATESLAYKNEFLERPVVDIWASRFREALEARFPDFKFERREFEVLSTIDVDVAFAYKNKGIIRTLGGFLSDIFILRLRTFIARLTTLLNFRPDPYNTLDAILAMHKDTRKLIFFFLVADYTTYDKNISWSNNRMQTLIKSVADYARIGLHPSYFSIKKREILKREKQRLESITNTPVAYSRQHYLRLKIPETYQQLLDLDIAEDHTMGYGKYVGFRASTCTPFYFYDLDFEIQTPLKVVPFACMDYTMKEHMKLTNEEAARKVASLMKEVRDVQGTFVSLFHNETLSEMHEWEGWNAIYKIAIDKS
jgi:hypothetical protein